jgi:hypothetical protein
MGMTSDDESRSVDGPAVRRPGRWALAGMATLAVVVLVVVATLGTGGTETAADGTRPVLAAEPVAPPPPTPTADPSSPGMPVPSHQDESDPFLLLDQGHYILYTSDIASPGSPDLSGAVGPATRFPINVPVASATSFGHWGPITDALPVLPPWATSGFTWAPDVHQFGSRYVLYFTALIQGSAPPTECIGDAVGSSPDGPFHPVSAPFICQADQGGSIDPRVFTDDAGTNWMLWKSDQNIGGASVPTKLWSQPLSADGLELTGSPVDIMQPDQPWQGTIVEAPDMVEVDGVDWVLYSGNWFNQPAYAIGAARCAGPQGPCADTSSRPLLGTNAQGAGPGEASFYQGATGVWMLYSPTLFSEGVTSRPVDITRIGFDAAGPYLAAGGPPPDLGTLPTSSRWPSAP